MKRIEIRRAYFFVTGTYNDMTLRPYETNFSNDNGMVNEFLDSTQGAEVITPDTVATIAGAFLRPSAQVVGVANIPNQWGTERLRFMIHLTVQIPDTYGQNQLHHKILQGYTSHVGVSPSGAVDDTMTLHFNGVMTYRESQIQTPHGVIMEPKWVETPEHVVVGTPRADIGQQFQTTRLMRPSDVFDNMSMINTFDMGLPDAQPTYGNFNPNSQVVDLATPFATSPVVKTSRNYSRSPHFVSSVFDAWREASREEEAESSFGVDDPSTHRDTFTMAKTKLRANNNFEGDVFFSRLNVETQFCKGGYITYRELRELAPEIDHPSVSTVYFHREVKEQQRHVQGDATQGLFPDTPHSGQSESWDGPSRATLWASILSSSIPALMVDNYLTYAAFHITNRTQNGQPTVTPMGINSIIPGNEQTLYTLTRQFLSRIETEIIRSLSQGNFIDYSVTMKVDVVGDTYIKIAIGGEPETLFTTPSFADSAFSPILAPNAHYVGSVGHEFHRFIDHLGQRLNQGHQQHIHTPSPFGGI